MVSLGTPCWTPREIVPAKSKKNKAVGFRSLAGIKERSTTHRRNNDIGLRKAGFVVDDLPAWVEIEDAGRGGIVPTN
ncbi:MAG: hypothetical protein OEM41_01130 [Ignavibacteria bacterium]|nr:hypothetical protein [Ignavibacteria bacterium]